MPGKIAGGGDPPPVDPMVPVAGAEVGMAGGAEAATALLVVILGAGFFLGEIFFGAAFFLAAAFLFGADFFTAFLADRLAGATAFLADFFVAGFLLAFFFGAAFFADFFLAIC